VVDADEPPLRIFFGKVPLGVATADYESDRVGAEKTTSNAPTRDDVPERTSLLAERPTPP
jgi:hypothetical protein